MVLLQSQSNDLSTDGVMAWLYHLYPGQPFVRVNDNIPVTDINYLIADDLDTLDFTIGGHTFLSHNLPGRWYRRGALHINKFGFKSESFDEFSMTQHMRDYMQQDLASLLEEIDTRLGASVKSINTFRDNKKGKLENICLAKKAGLHIPPTLFTNSADQLLEFVDLHGSIITKANHDNRFRIPLEDGVIAFGSSTRLLDREAVQQLLSGGGTTPSFFQAYIEKKYELRIFFLAGKCFAMAIFSQANEATKTDYRNYDPVRPNRCVPFQLPESIEHKLTVFMELMDMNCGSIDMIYTPEAEFIFLEVNPIGQFHWLEKNCNYFLEREIATFLQHKEHGH